MNTKTVQNNITLVLLTSLLALLPFAFVSAQEEEQSSENPVSVEEVEVIDLVEETANNASDITEDSTTMMETKKEETIKIKNLNTRKTQQGVRVIQNFDAQVKVLQNISGRLKRKAIAMNEAGLPVGSALTIIDTANNSLRTASGELRSMKEQVTDFQKIGVYEEGKVKEFRSLLVAVKSGLMVAKQGYVEALEVLKNAQ